MAAFYSSFQKEKKFKIGGVIKDLRGKELKKHPVFSIKDVFNNEKKKEKVSKKHEPTYLWFWVINLLTF